MLAEAVQPCLLLTPHATHRTDFRMHQGAHVRAYPPHTNTSRQTNHLKRAQGIEVPAVLAATGKLPLTGTRVINTPFQLQRSQARRDGQPSVS